MPPLQAPFKGRDGEEHTAITLCVYLLLGIRCKLFVDGNAKGVGLDVPGSQMSGLRVAHGRPPFD